MAENYACRQTGKQLSNQLRLGQMISIDMLPDDVLLAIFDFYLDKGAFTRKEMEAWQSLVHVCRRWRCLVFGSSRRLNLRLACSPRTPARGMLDVWPALPLFIRRYSNSDYGTQSVDNIIAALEHSDRVCRFELGLPGSQLEQVSAVMQEPFPELTHLEFLSYGTVSVLPDSFLGGSAPRLRHLRLICIPFPGFPKLHLSATHLHTLNLEDIPHSGYISPEAMAIAISTLTSLEYLCLTFQSPLSRPDRASQLPPPPTRSVLPVLTTFGFKGVSEYLDDLLARIDAPFLFHFFITFFNQIVFDTPQLVQLICRTPMLKAPERARVYLGDGVANVLFTPQTSSYGRFSVKIPCREWDWQLSSLEQVCTLCLPPLSTLEDLYIYKRLPSRRHLEDNVENTLWLDLLRPFAAVKDIYLSKKVVPSIVATLQELVGSRTTEVLPTLRNIFLEGLQPSVPIQEGIGKFVAARQVISHPVSVSPWDGNWMGLY